MANLLKATLSLLQKFLDINLARLRSWLLLGHARGHRDEMSVIEVIHFSMIGFQQLPGRSGNIPLSRILRGGLYSAIDDQNLRLLGSSHAVKLPLED